MRRLILRSIVLVLLVLWLGAGASLADTLRLPHPEISACDPDDGSLLLPDLIPYDPQDLFEKRVGGRRQLQFTTSVRNMGDGPLLIEGRTISTADGLKTHAWQLINRSDGSQCANAAGTFTFHVAHQHFHFDDYMAYELRLDGPLGRLATSGIKASFCLLDIQPVKGIPQRPRQLTALDCDSQEGIYGISVGYQDIYDRTLPEQWIILDRDEGSVPTGSYYLVFDVDPDHILWETRDDNNLSFVLTSVKLPPMGPVIDLPDEDPRDDGDGSPRPTPVLFPTEPARPTGGVLPTSTPIPPRVRNTRPPTPTRIPTKTPKPTRTPRGLPTATVEIPTVPPTVEIPTVPPTVEIPDVPPTVEIPTIPPTVEIPTVPPTVEIPDVPPTVEIPTVPPTVEIPDVPPTVEIPDVPPTVEIPTIPPTLPPATPTASQVIEVPTATPTIAGPPPTPTFGNFRTVVCENACPNYNLPNMRLDWYNSGLIFTFAIQPRGCPELDLSDGVTGKLEMVNWLTESRFTPQQNTGREHIVEFTLNDGRATTSSGGTITVSPSSFDYRANIDPIARPAEGQNFPVVFDVCLTVGDAEILSRMVCQPKTGASRDGLLCHQG